MNWRIALWVVVVGLAIAFLWAVRSVLPPFVLALLFAIILEPLIRKLGDRGVKRPIAVFGITFLFFSLLGLVIVLTAPRIADQLNEARQSLQAMADQWSDEAATDSVFVRWNPVVRAQPPGPLAVIDRLFDQARPILDQFELPSTRRAVMDQYIAPHRADIANAIQGSINRFVSGLGAAASSIFLLLFTPLFAVMILMNLNQMGDRASQWIPPSIRTNTLAILRDVSSVFQRYVQGVLINITCYGIVMSVVLGALNVPFAILLAMFAAVCYLIPFIGPWISAVTIVLVTAVSGVLGNGLITMQNPWFYALAVVFVTLTVVNMSWDTLVTPRIVGSAVNLDPLVSMFVVFSAGALFGLPGMVLAYPIAGIVKVTLARIMNVTNAPVEGEVRLPAIPPRHQTVIHP